jgi:hypothetical protein
MQNVKDFVKYTIGNIEAVEKNIDGISARLDSILSKDREEHYLSELQSHKLHFQWSLAEILGEKDVPILLKYESNFNTWLLDYFSLVMRIEKEANASVNSKKLDMSIVDKTTLLGKYDSLYQPMKEALNICDYVPFFKSVRMQLKQPELTMSKLKGYDKSSDGIANALDVIKTRIFHCFGNNNEKKTVEEMKNLHSEIQTTAGEMFIISNKITECDYEYQNKRELEQAYKFRGKFILYCADKLMNSAEKIIKYIDEKPILKELDANRSVTDNVASCQTKLINYTNVSLTKLIQNNLFLN